LDDAAKSPWCDETTSNEIATPEHHQFFAPSIPQRPRGRKRKADSA
jgi:hypothetical protein